MAQRLVPKMALTVVLVVGEVTPVTLPVVVIHLLGRPLREMTVALLTVIRPVPVVVVGGLLEQTEPGPVMEETEPHPSGGLRPPMMRMWFITQAVVGVVATAGAHRLAAQAVAAKGERIRAAFPRSTALRTLAGAAVVPGTQEGHPITAARAVRAS